MDIDQILDEIYPLPEDSKQLLKEYITEVKYPKGHILMRAEKIEPNFYFIKKGIVRAYASPAENEVTFWFGKEGDSIVSMRSYVDGKIGYENIELLEDCELYLLKNIELQRLFKSDVHIANYGRKFAERELVKTEERLISRLFQTATVRYQTLLKNNPDLLQRAPLGHIASYLGITQVSLSRIRAEIK